MSGKMSTGVRSAASGPTMENDQSKDDERIGPPQGNAHQANHAAPALRFKRKTPLRPNAIPTRGNLAESAGQTTHKPA